MCYRSLLGDAGLHIVGNEGEAGVDMRDLHQVLSDKMQMDIDAAASFVAGLRLYLADDALKASSSSTQIAIVMPTSFLSSQTSNIHSIAYHSAEARCAHLITSLITRLTAQ